MMPFCVLIGAMTCYLALSRHAEQRGFRHHQRGYADQPRCLPYHLDVVDQNQQKKNADKDAKRRDHEATGEIAAQGVVDHAHAAAGRLNSRARRALDLLIASSNAGGGSITMPPMMAQMLTAIAAASIKYWTRGAAGDFTAMTEQANPAMRRPNTARMEPPMEKLRLWRVVRGAPRKAKVRAAKAKG